jgi:hypothetical protein
VRCLNSRPVQHPPDFQGALGGPVKLPLCLCVKMVQKRPQMCYFFGPKCAIVDKDVTFSRCHVM